MNDEKKDVATTFFFTSWRKRNTSEIDSGIIKQEYVQELM